MRVVKQWDRRHPQAAPRDAAWFQLAPMGLQSALESLVQDLAEGMDPMECATRYALLVERARVLRLQMDCVQGALDCASQLMASRLAARLGQVDQRFIDLRE